MTNGNPYGSLLKNTALLPTTEGGGIAATEASIAGAISNKMPTPNSVPATFNQVTIPVRTPDGGMQGLGSIHRGQSPARNWNLSIDTTGLSPDTTHTIRLFDTAGGAECFATCDEAVPDGVVKMNGKSCHYEQLLRRLCGNTGYLVQSIRMTVSAGSDVDESLIEDVKNSQVWMYSYNEMGCREEGVFHLGLHNDPHRYNNDILDIPVTDKWSLITPFVGWELREIPAGMKINLLVTITGKCITL